MLPTNSRRRLALAALVLLAAAADLRAAPRVELDIPYAFGDRTALRRQSLDLYLPSVVAPDSCPPATLVHPCKAARPSLVVFIHGGFWKESDDRYGIGPRLAQVLAGEGAAVALVRYRLSPVVRHPIHIRDVAAALAHLKRSAPQYGYDASRLYLIGHSAGATIAASLALDPAHLKEVGMQPSDFAGVVLLSGIYDLGSSGPLAAERQRVVEPVFGAEAAVLRAASPVTQARRGPPFLVLSAADDLPGFASDARRFVRALRAAGHSQTQELIVPGQDHFGIANFAAKENVARVVVADFLKLKPMPPAMVALLKARQEWQPQKFSTEAFWKSSTAVRAYPVDARVRAAIERVYEYNAYELRAYPLKQYHALDLFAYLDALPKEQAGEGDYLIVTNARGERLFWRRQEIEAYRPVLVIGIDDERNLFRLTVFYQHRLEYSWRTERPPIMARSVGAFIHFQKEPPAALRPQTGAMYALAPDSLRRVRDDPLAALGSLPADVRAVMEYRNACLSCHTFRGVGARAGHIAAIGGKPHSGFALALESYPPEVWERFMFDQNASAKTIGVRANAVEGPVARKLFDLVVAERDRKPQ